MRLLQRFVYGLEWLAVVLLIVLALLGVAAFAIVLIDSQRSTLFASGTIALLLDEVFVLFILIELMKMAFAYMRGMHIIPVALEAMIVAMARKTVSLDFAAEGALIKAISLALLTTAVGVAWFLIGRTPRLDPDEKPAKH